jgi:hypothetical protein
MEAAMLMLGVVHSHRKALNGEASVTEEPRKIMLRVGGKK